MLVYSFKILIIVGNLYFGPFIHKKVHVMN